MTREPVNEEVVPPVEDVLEPKEPEPDDVERELS